MATQQQEWAQQLRAVPEQFQNAMRYANENTIRYRPAEGEWSAVEVIGHMYDKMEAWTQRVQRIASEDAPLLPGYDQDVYVRERGYQQANVAALFGQMAQACEDFARIVEQLPDSALQRSGVHSETGPITLAQCIEAPLNSVALHLEQFKTALTAGSVLDVVKKFGEQLS